MKITQDTANWLRIANEGEAIVNIGQISPATRRTLDKLTKRGQLVRATYIGFPNAKMCWVGAALPRMEWPRDVFETDPR